jgi:hypothetical protein
LTIDNLGYLGGNVVAADWKPPAEVDLIRNGRGYYLPGQFSGTTVADEAGGGPSAATRAVIATELQNAAFPTGTYKGSYSSTASIALNGAVNCSLANVVQGGGLTTFDLVVTGRPQIIIDLGGAAPSLQIIAPGYSEVSPPRLRTEALDHYKQFACLRFMDLTYTNNSTDVLWADRVPATRKIGNKRSWESVIAYANAIYAAPNSKLRAVWICVPHLADATYISSLAALLRDTLNSGLIIYVEWSNEVWNTVFSQFNDVLAAANAEVGLGGSNLNNDGDTNEYNWFKRLWGRNFKDMAQSFLSVFGLSNPNGRVRPVLAGQFVAYSTWTSGQIAWLAATYPSVALNTYCHTLSAAPYMQGSQAEMDAPADAAAMLAVLRTTGNNSLEVLKTYYQNWYNSTVTNGLAAPIAYECGPHTHFSSNAAVKYAAHLDAGMGTLCTDFLQASWARRWGLMCWWYVSPAEMLNNNENTLWQSSQDFGEASPKHSALLGQLTATVPAFVY